MAAAPLSAADAALLARVDSLLLALPPVSLRPQGGGRPRMTDSQRRKVWVWYRKRIIQKSQGVKLNGKVGNYRACAQWVFGKKAAKKWYWRIQHEFKKLP